jgi:TRAP-type C4-dicarboxylate transport system permease small subunit
MACGFCDDFKQWWHTPFRADMDAKGWALFALLIIVIFGMWGLVFRHIEGVLE